jgi:hypothetical protein
LVLLRAAGALTPPARMMPSGAYPQFERFANSRSFGSLFTIFM